MCNWPMNSGSKAIKIADDDDVELMLSATSKSIELFVGKSRWLQEEEPVREQVVNSVTEDYCRMIETVCINHGTAFPSFSNPHMTAIYGQQQSLYGYPSCTSYQQSVQYNYSYPSQDSFSHLLGR